MSVESGLEWGVTGGEGEDPVASFTEPSSGVADKTHAHRMVREPGLPPSCVTCSCESGKGRFW